LPATAAAEPRDLLVKDDRAPVLFLVEPKLC